jgi:hypothetical protein
MSASVPSRSNPRRIDSRTAQSLQTVYCRRALVRGYRHTIFRVVIGWLSWTRVVVAKRVAREIITPNAACTRLRYSDRHDREIEPARHFGTAG